MDKAEKRVIAAALYVIYCPDAGGYCNKEGQSVGRSIEDTWEELKYSVEALTGRKAKDGRAGWMTERPVENMISKIKLSRRSARTKA